MLDRAGVANPARQIHNVADMMWQICDAQSCEGHGEKAEIKRGVVGKKDSGGDAWPVWLKRGSLFQLHTSNSSTILSLAGGRPISLR
jgi:hypothetical protein